ncbi:knotted 1-binding protein [Rhynchospora pubera]|uniref:Knotted 1-binding protein n=1 Tax=Rhynchospora pubera TaxID=906938 RepID=A0AAV8BUZ4_9POAL|nr:knotted 1-binding protein [Rhynchospora pubera]
MELEGLQKRIKLSDPKEGIEGEGEGEHCVAASEETELQIQRILDKINSFTQQVSEILEAGKALFKDLSTDFEEHLISIHREQVEKWEEEMKEIRAHDSANEAAGSLLRNAQFHLFQNVHEDS